MTITKARMTELVRLARSMPMFRVSPTVVDMFCPLDVEARRKAWDQRTAHRFRIEGLRWDTSPKAADVAFWLARHLDPDAEDMACEHVRITL
jgi:hypothetical protein